MRILHLADVHIGVENYGRVDPETGLSTRLMDFLHTFDQAVDFSIDNRVDLVLFCGDAYKSRDPSQTHQREFARRIVRLSNEGIAAFLLIGNHDTPHVFGKATSLEIFRTLDAREFVTISVEVPRGDLDPTARVLRALSSRDLSGAVVRVQIRLPAELDPHLREADIRHALDDAHFVASVSREIEEERRTRLESDYTKALDPQVALETYLAQRAVPADRAQVLMNYARRLIAAEAEA